MIKVGVILPQSGEAKMDGNDAWLGIQLALNEAISQGNQLEVFVQDNQSDPGMSVRCVEELSRLGAQVIVGPIYSGSAYAAARAAEVETIPLIAPVATHPRVTANNPWAFRACFRDDVQGAKLAEFGLRDLGRRSLMTICDLTESYSLDLAREFESVFSEGGGRIVGRAYYRDAGAEAQSIAEAVAISGADVIFLPAYGSDVLALLEAGCPLWKDLVVLGTDGWDTPDLFEAPFPLGDSCTAFISNHFDLQGNERGRQFSSKFQDEFPGTRPGQVSVLAYDAFLLAVQATQDSSSSVGIRNSLAAISGFEGVSGRIRFTSSEGGDPGKTLVIQRVELGSDEFARLVFECELDP
ncbi:MAG: ABC transporter substrate-binding protein [Planctomycetes bacterium]|nr:ABC transporter substrate-binding protein [Planctomycetota bacterium]